MTRDEFDELAMGHLEEVTAFARRLAHNPADSDDLVQGTYERAFESWRDLKDPAGCRAWLFRIARNLFLDRWRAIRARPELRLVEPDDVLAPEPFVPPEHVARMQRQELEAALERVPEDQALAVVLCDLWGFEYAEIAVITRVPVGTVRSRIARGRVRLAEILAGAGASERGEVRGE